MATPREIKRRIVSVRNTQKITRAMQMVASVKLRRARDRVVDARPYFEKLTQIARHLTSGIPAGTSSYVHTGEARTCASWRWDRTRACAARSTPMS